MSGHVGTSASLLHSLVEQHLYMYVHITEYALMHKCASWGGTKRDFFLLFIFYFVLNLESFIVFLYLFAKLSQLHM